MAAQRLVPAFQIAGRQIERPTVPRANHAAFVQEAVFERCAAVRAHAVESMHRIAVFADDDSSPVFDDSERESVL